MPEEKGFGGFGKDWFEKGGRGDREAISVCSSHTQFMPPPIQPHHRLSMQMEQGANELNYQVI
jgi:hypothetical protein